MATLPALVGNEGSDAAGDTVADYAHAVGRLSVGVRQVPIESAQTRDERARIAAAHGDEQPCARGELGGEMLGTRSTEVEAHLAHGNDDFGMYAVGGL